MHVGSGDEVRVQINGITTLVAAEYAGDFNTNWFDPAFWGKKAAPVSAGGRGSAWFIELPGQSWVLRQYQRGGLVRKLVRSQYLYTGEKRVRSFAEFRLLQRMVAKGLPVPVPVAAMYNLKNGWYSASIVLERLGGVSPMGSIIEQLKDSDWASIGHTIREFHDQNVFHADLNCFNILIGASGVYVIDFDKGYIDPKADRDTPWKHSQLTRLKRSLRKVLTNNLDRGWRSLMQGYQGNSPRSH